MSAKRALAILLAISSILLQSCGTKQETVSPASGKTTVVRVSGRATLERAGQVGPLSGAGQELLSGDLLRTKADGKVDFRIEGRGLVQVGPDSEFVLRELQGAKSSALELKAGRTLLVLEKLKAQDSFSISTPTAIAGVRGTAFKLSAEKDEVAVSVLTGRVELQAGAGKSVMVEEKKEAFGKGQALGQAQSIRGARLAEVKELLTLPGVEKMGEYEKMKSNLKLLELGDEKSTADEMNVKGELGGQGITNRRRDMSETVSEGEKAKVKKRADQFSSDKDMMVK